MSCLPVSCFRKFLLDGQHRRLTPPFVLQGATDVSSVPSVLMFSRPCSCSFSCKTFLRFRNLRLHVRVRLALEEGVSSFASRMTQIIFDGHHDRTGAVLCITQNGVVRSKSWTRQTLSDAWESTNCGTSWQMVAPELRLTKKVTADKEGVGSPLPRSVVERVPEAETRRFYVLSAYIEAQAHTGGLSRMSSAGIAWKSDKATQ